MNTRLQVEHPVTEMLTGLDLVAWQIRVARGEPLPPTAPALQGHAIEVRLCAEDANFVPHSGRVAVFAEPPAMPGQRFDHALESGLEVTPHYDPMLGKLIVHAATRDLALAQLAAALDATVLLGLPNNRGLLAACLRHPVFAAGEAHTGFLAEHAEALRAAMAPPPEAVLGAVLAAAYPMGGAARLPCAWARPLRWRCGEALLNLSVRELGHGGLRAVNGERVHEAQLKDGAISLDGLSLPVRAVALGEGTWQVQMGPHTLALQDLSLAPREGAATGAAALELRAPFNGRLVQVHTQAGAPVARGETLFTLESMKIEHRLDAPRDGTVAAVHVAGGQQVAPGQVLLRFAENP
jgi:geranyl-CoA carboxylase alpha subunit